MAVLPTYQKPHRRLEWTISIVITRIGPRALDKDNAYRSAKAVTDGIADALKIDDGDDRLHWKVHQKKGRSNEYAVNIYITPLPS